MSSSSWCTVESDPGVFTELISQIGVQGVQVEELYDLEQEHLDRIKPVFGLIFLFKYQQSPLDAATQTLIRDDHPLSEEVYFARQMITNACGTQAILNLILNLDASQCAAHGITLGEELRNFKEFTQCLPPDMRGEAISNSELIRKAHNGFARPEPFVFEEKKSRDDEGGEDAFHFIGYLPVNGRLYELDGLKPGPILLHEAGDRDSRVSQENWLAAARGAIQARLQQYAAKEIRFNLMALIGNRSAQLTKRIAQVQRELGLPTDGAAAMDTSSDSAASAASAATPASAATSASSTSDPLLLREELEELQRQLQEEESKMSRWRVENARRKHSYVPFIFNLLRMLAEKGKLAGLVEAAVKGAAERAARTRQAAKRKEPSASASPPATAKDAPPAPAAGDAEAQQPPAKK